MKNMDTESISSRSESESCNNTNNNGNDKNLINTTNQSKSDDSSTNSISTGDSPRSSTVLSTGNDRTVELSRKETEHVNRLRLVVLIILLLVAISVSVLVYFITKQTEEEEMQAQFESVSARLVDAFNGIRTERIATLASLAIAAIAHGTFSADVGGLIYACFVFYHY
jgi:hypothetical protein